MLAQRFPDDFDGIVSVVPIIHWSGLFSSFASFTDRILQVPVDLDIEQHRRVSGRPAGASGPNTIEAEVLEVQLFDKGIRHTDRVVLRYEVVEALRQQGDLGSVLPLDESLHVAHLDVLPPLSRTGQAINSFLHIALLHPGRAPVRPVAKLGARVLCGALEHEPNDGPTHWSSRTLALGWSTSRSPPCSAS